MRINVKELKGRLKEMTELQKQESDIVVFGDAGVLNVFDDREFSKYRYIYAVTTEDELYLELHLEKSLFGYKQSGTDINKGDIISFEGDFCYEGDNVIILANCRYSISPPNNKH